ncbi:biotin transporter BioY [candidate division KSB1 bacterium]|nr:biotin transporter BioY [candidate division KSB1 bacterium]
MYQSVFFKLKASTRQLTLTALFTGLTIVGGWIRVPVTPVPFTLQTLFVLMSGAILGARGGSMSQILYLLLGLAGFPVFANGGGLSYILQPGFGYLLGFPVAAYTVGKLIQRQVRTGARLTFFRLLLVHLPGVFIIAGLGSMGLYFNLKYLAGQSIRMPGIWVSGCLIFLPFDFLKIGLSSMLTLFLYRQGFICAE